MLRSLSGRTRTSTENEGGGGWLGRGGGRELKAAAARADFELGNNQPALWEFLEKIPICNERGERRGGLGKKK